MMKDVTRTVQESMLESAGALTADAAAQRRHQRMQHILELVPTPAPAETPAAPAPGAPTGPLAVPEAFRRTLPDVLQGFQP